MSPPDSSSPVRSSGARPKPDVYTVLLGIALAAVIVGCLFMGLELGRYGWDVSAAGS